MRRTHNAPEYSATTFVYHVSQRAAVQNRSMSSPWLAIPLEDYEGHISSVGVQQLTALAELFKDTLDTYVPESVALLGVAGGNGLEHIDCAVTKRILGVDINHMYLDVVQQRFGTLPGLELHRCDLAEGNLSLAPVELGPQDRPGILVHDADREFEKRQSVGDQPWTFRRDSHGGVARIASPPVLTPRCRPPRRIEANG